MGTADLSKQRRSFLLEAVSPQLLGSARSEWRYVVGVQTADGTVKRVLGGRPDWIRDNHKQLWLVPRMPDPAQLSSTWATPYTALGMAGELCSVNTLLLRDVPMAASRKLLEAPVGPMADELRSALPVSTVPAGLRAEARRLFHAQRTDTHPGLLQALGYSFAVEGCVTVVTDFCPAGTLRDVVQRYAVLRPVSVLRFGLSIVSALCHLHAKGRAHGSLSLDSVHVGADGVCRLLNRYTDNATAARSFVLPDTCYVSPAMAAGRAPTPACDVFCLGMVLLEALTRRRCWTWAAGGGGSQEETEEELLALMAGGGPLFRQALLSGRVVLHTALLDAPAVAGCHGAALVDVVRAMLRADPAQRPTASDVLSTMKAALLRHGVTFDESEGSSAS